MGCQLEPHGAALCQLQKSFASQDVLLCGVDRIEHPYDVEDYLRHFGFTFPVFVDLNQESPSVTWAPLGSVAILDQARKRVRVAGKVEFEPIDAKSALSNLMIHSSSGMTHSSVSPGIHRLPGESRNPTRPRMEAPGWREPVRLGTGQYPRIICFQRSKALCLWVTGELRQQHIEYAVWTGSQWGNACSIDTGPDAHAVAVDVDAKDYPVIVWSQKDPDEYRVYLSAFDGSEWRRPVAVSPPGNDAFRPDVFRRPSGAVAVVWYGWKRVRLKDYSNAWCRSIYVSDVVDNQPGAVRELAELRRGSDDCWDPILTGSGSGLQVSWLRDDNPPKLCGSVYGAAGWSRPDSLLRLPGAVVTAFRVQASSPLRSATDRRGLVFELDSPGQPRPFLAGTHVYLAMFATNQWADPVPLSNGLGRHVAPTAVQLADGECVVFWCHLRGKTIHRLSGCEPSTPLRQHRTASS